MQHQISNYTFTIFDKFQYENRTEKQGQFSCKNAGQKSLWFNYIYIFLNKVFSQVSEHTYIVLQESKGKKKHLTIRFSRQITVIKNYPLHLHTTTKNYKLNVCQNIRETHLCFKKKKNEIRYCTFLNQSTIKWQWKQYKVHEELHHHHHRRRCVSRVTKAYISVTKTSQFFIALN